MARRKPIDAKRKALQEQGTLHHRPEAVTDALFRTHGFFDPCDLVQVKYEMLRRVRVEGQSVTHAAAAFGLSRLSFYQAQAAFERAGVAGLLPKKRGPHGPHKLTDEVMHFVRRARLEDPSRRGRDLARLVGERFRLQIHPRTIERALAQREKKRR
ncbi:MAG: helix-turn-helix domain-containing protein [Planctomycetota bacterium]|jgi:transposase